MQAILIILIISIIVAIILAIVALALSIKAMGSSTQQTLRQTIYNVTETSPTVPVVSKFTNAPNVNVLFGSKTNATEGSQINYYTSLTLSPQNTDNEVTVTVDVDSTKSFTLFNIDNMEANVSYTIGEYNYTIVAGIKQVSGTTFNITFQPANTSLHTLNISCYGLPSV